MQFLSVSPPCGEKCERKRRDEQKREREEKRKEISESVFEKKKKATEKGTMREK